MTAPKVTWILLASAPDLGGIAECIARFYGGERKPLAYCEDHGVWVVLRSERPPMTLIEDVRVIRSKSGRYRFEMSR